MALRQRPMYSSEINGSHEAERAVLPIVDQVLRNHRWHPCDKKFPSFWRDAITDGAWEREDGFPRRLAIEVKLNEDVEQPFTQIVEDLGYVDAVIQVRLVKQETRKKLSKLPLEAKVKKTEAEERLPIRFIKIPVVSDR